MATLRPDQMEAAKAWLYDLLVSSKLIKVTKKIRDDWYYNNDWYYSKSDAQQIVSTIMGDRTVGYQKFLDLDKTLEALSKNRFTPSLTNPQARTVKKSADVIATYIAYFCNSKQIYWDNSLCTPFEMDEIKKTKLGSALWDYNCFTSQYGTTSAIPSKVKTASPSASSTRTAPTVGYKALGGLSNIVPNLISRGKVYPGSTNSLLYCIEADKLGANTPCIFITPVRQDGTQVSAANASAVKVGSGNGYSDCKLWWEDLNVAQDFLNKCQQKFSNSKFGNLHIAKGRNDSNGYFEVSTEFGNAFIKASRLNEEIVEAIENEQEIENPVPKKRGGYTIKNIDVYDEAFDRCLN